MGKSEIQIYVNSPFRRSPYINDHFLKILGQHTQDSGLSEVWVESRLLEQGNNMPKAHAHKLKLSSFMAITASTVISYIEEHDHDLMGSIFSAQSGD